MARLAALLGLATVISQCSAHFLLNHPVTYGFNDDAEGTAPCGGFSVAFDHNVTDFHVDGDSISMTTTHPSTTWLLRAMVGNNTAAANWTNLIPTVQQSGLGDFCQPTVTVPSAFAGNKGVVNVVADGPDGLLYQCAAVSFVQGAATDVPSTCKNGTGVSASYAADAALSSLPASATATATASSSSGTAAASSSSAAGALTVGPMQYGTIGSLVWVGSVSVASFVAFLL
ncbi:5e51d6da-3483-4f72-9575-30b317ca74d8 [Sclerotinia trifoliorum]|uniref:5e51d6da-3483-4f72-9575-30b317ca74d8 n=1 Tax=Sclerotinia trifoliorum TaxID=28548 RepID=A0A8H2VTI6_9HELO|nr:5e51d6da-3483-4f72-9575-30b317ca74d8 [Sclerotinia trifoliorum]